MCQTIYSHPRRSLELADDDGHSGIRILGHLTLLKDNRRIYYYSVVFCGNIFDNS